jgi:VWFA-related protein
MILPLLLLAFQEPTFRADVNLVHVDAEVSTKGRPIDGLHKQDFRVTDGGKPREILYFAHQETPLDVILLFDTSLSMFNAIARVAETAGAALGQLREGDRAAVMAFDARTDLIADFTGDFESVRRAIQEQVLRRPFKPVSPIQKAVDDAARHFLKQPESGRRRAVLIITDNHGSWREPRALSDMWEADAVLAGVIVPGSLNIALSPQMFLEMGISSIAERTGGDTLKSGDAGDDFHQMIQRLRLRYSLHYALPETKPGEERKIKVELSKEAAKRYPGSKVRARSGYIVPSR